MKTSRKRSQFIVRELRTETELSVCLALDHSYTTDHVWQMDGRTENDTIHVRFRTVRLPRTMLVDYPRNHVSPKQSWENRDCFLVAIANDHILGYVNMRIDATRTKGWIHDLIVGQPFRHRQIGGALLEQTTRWAQLRHINHLTLEMHTKNHPGIQFAQAHGFVFCGFNDRYYPNQDIAIFFGKNL